MGVFKDTYLAEEVQYINLGNKPTKTTIGQIDSANKKFGSIITMIKKYVGASSINDSLEALFLNNPKKKSKKTKLATSYAMNDITNHLKSDGINIEKVVDGLNTPFVLKDGDYSMEELILEVKPYFDDEFYTTIFKRVFGTAGGAQMGPGEYALWLLFNNVDFNDVKGDLIIGGKKVEVKGFNATVGTNSLPFKDWTTVKKILANMANTFKYDDIDFIDAMGLGQKNAVGLVKMLAFINKQNTKDKIMDGLALTFINTSDTEHTALSKEFKDILLKVNDNTDPLSFCQQLVAYHLKNYQFHDEFDFALIYKDANKAVPTGCVVIDPRHYSIEALAKKLTSYKIRFNGWSGARLGGCIIKNIK